MPRPCSFFASENDMNVLIRGVRFSMRIGRAKCVKDILEPRADSTDTKDFFYMGDADPDRVRTMESSFSYPPFPICLPPSLPMLICHRALRRCVTGHGRRDQGIHPQPLQRCIPSSECPSALRYE